MTELFERTVLKEGACQERACIVIQGEKGSGKTTLAKNLYLNDENFFDGAYLFDCTSEFFLYNSCSALIFCDTSQPYIHPNNLNECIERVKQIIKNRRETLFIFDNVKNETLMKVKNLIPCEQYLRIVITTTEEDLMIENQKIVKLFPLNEDKALRLVKRRLKGNLYDEVAAKNLIKSLDCNPEKIIRVVTYCDKNCVKLTLFEQYNEKRKKEIIDKP